MVVFNSAVSTVDFPTNRLEIYVINGVKRKVPQSWKSWLGNDPVVHENHVDPRPSVAG